MMAVLAVETSQSSEKTALNSNRYMEAYKQYSDAQAPLPKDKIKHFVFISRYQLKNHVFLKNSRIAGAQILYPWTQLETDRSQYNFKNIRDDLHYLLSKGKKLFIQLQDTTFHPKWKAVPDYMQTPEFDGGQFAKQNHKGLPSGWIAKRWNPIVQKRFALLLQALAEEFDGHPSFEGINLPETAAEGLDSQRDPTFTPEVYAKGIKANMLAMKKAFRKSVTMQYANFMPGEWLPWEDKGYLRAIYQHGEKIGVGLGGPDLMPKRKAQLNHALALMHEGSFTVPLGVAVQRGNYIGMTGADVDPGESITKDGESKDTNIPLLHAFAKHFLNVQYIFWQNEEPYFSNVFLTILQ